MRYIKARYKLTSPSAEDYTVYGWDTEFLHKTQMINNQPVEIGSIVDFQALPVKYNGRCVIAATPRNIKRLKVMIELGQMVLGPDEKLESAIPTSVVVEEWPEAPRAAEEKAEENQEELPVAAAKRARRKASEAPTAADSE